MVVLQDPANDDKGPGTYTYPSNPVYTPGSFDLRSLEVEAKGSTVEFRVEVDQRIDDAWDSKAWGGNGFSIQMAFIHIDTGEGGATTGMPGTNVRFAEDQAWNKVVIISPQGPTRVNSEVDAKAPDVKDLVIVPKLTRARGRTLTAVVSTEDLGGLPSEGWGYQVLMQSNEGFPGKTDLLTRKVNEFEGEHRFGGGTDFDNDPHVMDIFAGSAKGAAGEVQAQYDALAAYNSDAGEDATAEDLAVVPMIYPGS
ncbi:MAG: glucodextranase DOMON-like domain-containing protein [Myxococcota bacterium]